MERCKVETEAFDDSFYKNDELVKQIDGVERVQYS